MIPFFSEDVIYVAGFFALLKVIGVLLFFKIKKRYLKKAADKILGHAENQAQTITKNAELKAKEIEHQAELFVLKIKNEKEKDQLLLESQLKQDREKLERERQQMALKVSQIEKKEKELKCLIDANRLAQKEHTQKMQTLAGLTEKEAKDQLLNKMQHEIEHDAAHLFEKKMQEMEKQLETRAFSIITSSLERLAEKHASETANTLVVLTNDAEKAKIIGRDGKNLRAFEKATGVSVIIDDTPACITLSSFDPMRRYLAKLALDELLQEGRFHPLRIEEVVKKHELLVNSHLLHLGEQAAMKAGVSGLDPEIARILGKLHFRSSLGQNTLDHSVEVSQILSLIASELNLNTERARRIGLLHDIGKALSLESGHSHAITGMHFLIKHGESEEVANGVGCHHEEVSPKTKEAALLKIADRLSSTRKGARSDSSNKHMTRLENLEKLALEFDGVEKAFCMQAGKELRVFVHPEKINDIEASHLAKMLSKRIEETIPTSSTIHITVVRETQVTEYIV